MALNLKFATLQVFVGIFYLRSHSTSCSNVSMGSLPFAVHVHHLSISCSSCVLPILHATLKLAFTTPPPSRNSQGIPFVCFKKRKHSICCTSLHHLLNLLNSFMRLFRNGSALLSLLQKPAASSTSSTYARLPNVEQYYHHC